MKTNNMTLTEQLHTYQHYHSGKIDKHEYPTSEEIFAPDQNRIIE